MPKKILAVFLTLITCLGIVSCSKSDVPEGMHLVSLESDPFKLYVPEAWTDNTVSGISGAFYAGTDNIAVSARYYTPEDEEMSLATYVNGCINTYAEFHEDFYFDGEVNSAVLGDADAMEIVFTADHENVEFTFRQLFVKHDGDFIILSFRCPTEGFETYNSQFTEIKDAFRLCEKGEVKNDCVTDKKTPDGMKIASNDAIEYRFYVPQTWICDSESGASEAYYPESGKPNVTVTSYIPDNTMTAEQYFEACEKRYKDNIDGYELLDTEARVVGERKAVSYTYSAVYGGTKFRIMQTVFVYSERVYSITYTAIDDTFDGHLDDVESILDAFRFR